ncbi:MAG: glycosyltransferase [Candidatus Nitrosocaldus sp.]|nr:hypothetical protein [Candidatus Nitrosocaldus sp.]MDW8275032.1 glycosyltransferase [Candidatus Nitrosocaldus sp.]
MVRILFLTSPIGLGHASRDIAVADELVGSGVGMDEILFVTGGAAYSHIRDSGYNVLDAYRGKSIDASDGVFRHRLIWLLDYLSFYRECKRIASSIIASYRPALVVSDEDFAGVAAASTLGTRSVLITDVFESRFLHGPSSLLERILNRYLRSIIAMADMVIVPMNVNEEDEYVHGYAAGNVVYVGPMVRRVSRGRDELRRVFGFDGYRVILVSVGGTSSGRFLVERAIDAYTSIMDSFSMPTKLVIVSGPSIDVRIPDGVDGRVECHGYVRNMHEMVYAADLLISLAGRSTMDEARVYGTPSVFIPIKGHFEQEENARRYGFSYEDVYRLEDIMLEYLSKSKRHVSVSNGANEAASRILSMLHTKY